MSRSADERGLAAPVVVTLTGLLLVLTLVGGVLGRLLVDQRRVSAAADLAALAGAGAMQVHHDACAAAGRTARSNGAALTSCTVSGEQVAVTASLTSTGMAGLFGLLGRTVAVEADALAGPVDGPGAGPATGLDAGP